MNTEPAEPRPTRTACLDEALTIIGERGIEALSLREVARRLGLSHQAPYKHFASREHLLAELVAHLYEEFASHLDDRPEVADAFTDLGNMGVRYLDYAFREPLKYRLLFNAALPDPAAHPTMLHHARHAFEILETRLAGMRLRGLRDGREAEPRADAFFVWSVLHGIASILGSDAISALDVPEAERDRLVQHMFDRIGSALGPSDP